MKFTVTGTEIGGGAYGRLFEVEYEGTLCTAREVDSLQSISIFAQGDDKVLQDSFLSKYHTWSTLHHPCIVQFIGIYGFMYIILSYTYKFFRDVIFADYPNLGFPRFYF